MTIPTTDVFLPTPAAPCGILLGILHTVLRKAQKYLPRPDALAELYLAFLVNIES